MSFMEDSANANFQMWKCPKKKEGEQFKMIQGKLSQVEQRWKVVGKEARQEAEQKTLPSFTPFQTSYVYEEEQI